MFWVFIKVLSGKKPGQVPPSIFYFFNSFLNLRTSSLTIALESLSPQLSGSHCSNLPLHEAKHTISRDADNKGK